MVSTMSTTEPIVPIDEPIEPVEPVNVRVWQIVRVIQTLKTLESLYDMRNQRAAPHFARSVPRSLAVLTKANTASTTPNTIAQTVLQVPHVSTAGLVAVHSFGSSFGSFRLKADPQNVWHNVWLDSTRSGCVQLLDARIVADHVGHDGQFMATVLFATRHHTVPGRLLRTYYSTYYSGSTARPGNQRRSHRIVRRLAYVVHSRTAELTRWLLSLWRK